MTKINSRAPFLIASGNFKSKEIEQINKENNTSYKNIKHVIDEIPGIIGNILRNVKK